MSRNVDRSCVVMVVALLLTHAADAQETRPDTGTKPVSVARPPDFKVVVWYHAGTWRAIAYDVRKGEFNATVEEWVGTWNRDPYGEAAHILLPQLAYIKEITLEPTRPGTTGSDERAVAMDEALAWRAAKEVELLQDKLRAVSASDFRRLRLHQLYPSGSLRSHEADVRSRLSGGVNQPAPMSGQPSGTPAYLLSRPR